jgi:hypothetical protein
MFRLRVLCLICACLLFASVTTKADTISFDFTGNGMLDFNRPMATTIRFQSVGIYDSALGVFRSMSNGVIDLTVINNDNSAPNRGEFRITFGDGDKLVGTFTGSVFPVDANGIARFVLSYTITGGMGIFTGASGSGSEEIRQDFATSAFVSKGNFNINVPGGVTPIPEPATLLLLGMGLAGIASKLKRKK